MHRATSWAGRWSAFWPLVLIALAVRISFGNLALPAEVLGDPVAQLERLSVLCDGQKHDGGTPRPHLPADAGEGVLLLGDALAISDLGSGQAPVSLAPFTILTQVWYFPPVRGPPSRCASALCAQGPPV